MMDCLGVEPFLLTNKIQQLIKIINSLTKCGQTKLNPNTYLAETVQKFSLLPTVIWLAMYVFNFHTKTVKLNILYIQYTSFILFISVQPLIDCSFKLSYLLQLTIWLCFTTVIQQPLNQKKVFSVRHS